MKLTIRDWSGILLGVVLGVVFCLGIELRASGVAIDWPKAIDSGKNIIEACGVVVAGAWTYALFVRQRLGRARANLEHSVVISTLQDGRMLVRAILEIQNVGAIVLRPPHGTVSLSVVVPEDPAAIAAAETTDRTADKNWPPKRKIDCTFSADHLKLEPGEKERYPFDFIVPAGTKAVQVHSEVNCGDGRAPKAQWDETTLHNLEPAAKAAEAECAGQAPFADSGYVHGW